MQMACRVASSAVVASGRVTGELRGAGGDRQRPRRRDGALPRGEEGQLARPRGAVPDGVTAADRACRRSPIGPSGRSTGEASRSPGERR
jgi:hypothetical protein